jgi:beta-glucanase (GH16 family)
VWADEFNGDRIDPSRWNVFDWRRGEAQDTPDAVEVKDGILRISTYSEGGVQKTGFLSTEYGKYEATHGYFEARIRFHGVSGQWCAFWLTSPTIGDPLGDPARAGAEIDVVEHRIVDESGWRIGDWVAQNVIWDGYDLHRADVHHGSPLPDGAPVNGAWHTFGVLWDDAQYVFYVDANELWRTSAAVSQRSEYVLLTCEILDHDWAGNVPAGGYGPKSGSSPGMEVDWVRVWRK